MNRELKGPNDRYTVGYRTMAGNLINSAGEAANSAYRLYDPHHYAAETEFGKGVLDALQDWERLK